MRPLKDVLAALHEELDRVFEAHPRLQCGTRLEAERVVLSLEVAVLEEKGTAGQAGVSFGVEVVDANAAGAMDRPRERHRTHTLTLEFKPHLAPTSPPVAPDSFSDRTKPLAPDERSGRIPDVTADRIRQLALVLGAPGGFYSYCRADIFKTAVEELSAAEYSDLLAGLGGQPLPEGAPQVLQAYGQIRNILRSGPANSVEKGASILRAALGDITRADLKSLLENTWKNEAQAAESLPVVGAHDSTAVSPSPGVEH
jgi:hypothetical protein